MKRYLYLGLFLTLLIFVVDLLYPWSSVGIFYAIVILFAQRSKDQRLVYIFAAIGSALTLMEMMYALPDRYPMLFIMNGALQLGLLWTVTFVGRDQSLTRAEMERTLRQRAQRERDRLEQVLNFESRLTDFSSLDDVADFAVPNVCAILEATRCSFMMVDEKTKELKIKGHAGLEERVIAQTRVAMGASGSVAGSVAKEGRPLLVKDIATDTRFGGSAKPGYRTTSFISAPMKINNRVVGVLSVTDRKSFAEAVFDELDLKILCMLIHQIENRMDNIRRYHELNHLATTDPKTGLYNFRAFSLSARKELDRMRRYRAPLSLLMIDVDNFKMYNDTYGHLAGDALLKNLSQTLQRLLRSTDILCRYGGDEFVIILPNTDLLQASHVVEKIQQEMFLQFHGRRIGMSIGLAEADPADNQETWVKRADEELYASKRKKKDVTC